MNFKLPLHCRKIAHSQKLINILEEIFEEKPKLFKEKINFKQAGGDGFKHHQDQAAGWSDYSDFFISALVCIDEANKENGTLEVLPHTRQSRNLIQEWEPFSEEQIMKMEMKAIDLFPGDAVIFDSYLIHGSYPNLSDSQRRVMYLTYARESEGDIRTKYYDDKSKSYPQDCERDPNKEYKFRV